MLFNDKSSGRIRTGSGNDILDYNSGIGTLNTNIVGGAGVDTLRLNNFGAENALNLLKSRGYSLGLDRNGFSLFIANQQSIRFDSVERIELADANFDLRDPVQLRAFVGAVKGADIPIRGVNISTPTPLTTSTASLQESLNITGAATTLPNLSSVEDINHDFRANGIEERIARANPFDLTSAQYAQEINNIVLVPQANLSSTLSEVLRRPANYNVFSACKNWSLKGLRCYGPNPC